MRVLFSVRTPSPTTNPYVVQLAQAVGRDVDVSFFSWRTALLGGYDIWHVHWPEVVLRRAGRLARTAAQVRFALVLLRLQVLRTPVVRTLHNIGAHERGSGPERLLLRWLDRRTTYWIRLNADTPVPAGAAGAVIPHGHYVDWFARHPRRDRRLGRVVNFGLIRPYKGVDALLAAFRGLPDERAELRILGRPSTAGLRAEILDAQASDPRVSCVLDYLDDAQLAAEISEGQLVVLPYRDMHNSGALLLALSLGRPVLVPGNPTTQALSAEVGPGWVLGYAGAAPTTADLGAALAASVELPAAGPNLTERAWATVGEQHVQAYRAAVSRGRWLVGGVAESLDSARRPASGPVEPDEPAGSAEPLR